MLKFMRTLRKSVGQALASLAANDSFGALELIAETRTFLRRQLGMRVLIRAEFRGAYVAEMGQEELAVGSGQTKSVLLHALHGICATLDRGGVPGFLGGRGDF